MAGGIGLLAGVSACSSPLAPAFNVCATSVTFETTYTTAVANDLDLIFVIDDSAAMAGWQTQLGAQLATLAMVASSPNDPHGLHLGVVSSDLGIGAVNAALPSCTARGDAGAFRSQPEATCTDTTLDPGATFISEIGAARNFSAPDDAAGPGVAKVFQCIAQLGAGGCEFGQPLAALERALGADGQPPPAANAGFLRPDATLGIVIISSEDDCSAAIGIEGATLFSSDVSVDGPFTHYRCNHAGHLCQDPQDPSGRWMEPPLDPPADATVTGGGSALSLVNCESHEGGELISVSKFVADIRSLKADPDNQILVSVVVGPPAPYTVEWPPGAAGPQIAPSCGTRNPDGSGAYGEPGVRITQFANAFPNSIMASICDQSYAPVLDYVPESSPVLPLPPCVPANIQSKTDAQGNSYPDCVVNERLKTASGTQEIAIPPCLGLPGDSPCWMTTQGFQNCPGQSLMVQNEPVGPDPGHYAASLEISCQLPAPDAGACPQ
jgi:hypothetical protein